MGWLLAGLPILCTALTLEPAGVDSLPEGVREPRIEITEVSTFIGAFFSSLIARSPVEALERVKDQFPLDPAARVALGGKIDELISTLGALEGFEVVGWTEPVTGRRLVSFSCLTYHRGGPAVWEVLVYRTSERWQILKIKFSTDDVLEQLRARGLLSTGTKGDSGAK